MRDIGKEGQREIHRETYKYKNILCIVINNKTYYPGAIY